MKTIKVIIILGQILFLFLYNFYCYSNKTNHTAEDFIFWANLSLLFGATLLFTTKLKPNLIGKTDKLIIIIFSLSLLTSINIYAFDYFNIMVEHSKWAGQRRFAEKPFWNE